jgi:3-oxocholest-4-en-26-oyl-CoA dehydrogenase alpha subunit
VRDRLGRVAVDLEAALVTPDMAGRVKGSEALISCAAELTDLLGPAGVLSEGTPEAPGGGQVDFAHRFAQGTATYGGTVEVYRAMIAQHVLSLPRPNYPGAKVLAQKKR